VFLTLGAVRGDAERGLLQPLLVRPVSRRTLLTARFVSAAVVCAAYVAVVYAIAVVETGLIGGWWPDRPLTPALALAMAVVVVAALSVVGSVFLSSTANGIAVFMAFGAGLVAGLLGQIADVLNSENLTRVSDVIAYALPFEALYQFGLAELTAGTVGFTRFALQLGPLGGARAAGIELWLWALVYLALVIGAGAAAFNRRDL
jgi:ABC-type transport system involved in multi-copper enzyme maturation permease subunit